MRRPQLCSTKFTFVHTTDVITDTGITLGFEKTNYTVYEDDSTLEVCVICQGGRLNRPLDLTIASSDGSASAPMDYSNLFLTTNFLESVDHRLCVNVTIVDDLLLEDDESFTLLLTSADRAVSMTLNSTTVTILDNDAVTLVLHPSHLAINESSEQVQVTIQLIGGLEREVSFILESADGTASSLTGDYKSFSSRLFFPIGSDNASTITVAIDIVDDLLLEETEYFTVHASSVDGHAHFKPGRDSTTFIIEDDDSMFSRSLTLPLILLTHSSF